MAATCRDSLAAWLEWLEGLHPSAIDLGLERVGAVAARLDLLRPRAPVITVAGTNGKGSVCAFIEAILEAGGQRVGLYTSPHLVRYNERVRIGGVEVDDDSLIAAFARVERAREGVSLTYFEFGTLAALDLFARAAVDVIVLETGLGGRLDATNIVDASVAVVTAIGIDHADWLGADRDGIAREKAGIARAGRPLLRAEPEPPGQWPEIVRQTGAVEYAWGRAYGRSVAPAGDTWSWWMGSNELTGLPMPALAGGYQVDNAAAAVAAVTALQGEPPARAAVTAGLGRARVPGRFEVFPGTTEVILDVGHNPQAAATLAAALAGRPGRGRTLMVIAMYADKDVDGVVTALATVADEWFCAPLPPPRGLDAAILAGHARKRTRQSVATCETPEAALTCARAQAGAGDRIVVTGSFATVARVRALFL